MRRLLNFSPLELLLLLATSLLGLLATILEVIQNTIGYIQNGELTTVHILKNELTAFIPSITVSPLNHIMILASIAMSALGLYAFLKESAEARKVWIYLQVPYWFVQFYAFIVIGVYPLVGIFMGLYLGVSIYLALNQRLGLR